MLDAERSVLVSGATGRPATMLRPVAFMENYYVAQVEIGILKGKLVDPVRAEKTYQTIASDDIGAFAALASRARPNSSGSSSRSRAVS
jgi:uncharacterized protein YbjT (DUF2867 family)